MALGFYCGSDAYLRSGWNVLDFSLVVCSIIDTLFVMVSKSSPKILGILRVFRLLRTLRPLRVISRAPGLKLVVQEHCVITEQRDYNRYTKYNDRVTCI